jgi:peptidoglycan/xylan/chitin deacetylase (PgdA/CDA1 family)
VSFAASTVATTYRTVALGAFLILPLAGWASPRPILPHVRPAEPVLVLPRHLPDRTLRVPILMYHRIGASPVGSDLTADLTVSPPVFAAQMRWLHRAGFHAVTQRQLFAALEHGARLPPRPLLITFDDGYRDVLWNAAPVLRRLHMPATVYAITGRIDGGDPSFLSWPELRRLVGLGFDVGSHTVHHVELTAVPPGTAVSELAASKAVLERRLGEPVQWLSYPAGKVDAEVERLARRDGYVLAVTTRPGDRQSGRRPLLLGRFEILDTTGVSGLEALLASVHR